MRLQSIRSRITQSAFGACGPTILAKFATMKGYASCRLINKGNLQEHVVILASLLLLNHILKHVNHTACYDSASMALTLLIPLFSTALPRPINFIAKPVPYHQPLDLQHFLITAQPTGNKDFQHYAFQTHLI